MTTRALLFADVVGSTDWVRRVGDLAAAELWSEHDRRARSLLAKLGGREIDRSDGFFLLFDAVADAARFAAEYHEAIASLGIAARVGIHHGEVTMRENASDAVARGAKPIEVEGLAKPLAARLMGLAAGGQTLLSGAAVRQGGWPDGLQLRSHGHYRFKGFEEPLAVHELGNALSGFVPPPDADKAYRVAADGDLWMPLRQIPHNLAPERDAFIGRRAELRLLAETLAGGARLVSVLGVGGTGKTRLVRRYAQAWLGEWPGGVTFCDLSEARSLDGICYAVAAALDVALGREDPVVQLGHAIAQRGACLLILDNFEQVVGHAEACVGRWLDGAANCRIVVTSRERLQVAGETPFALEPLPVASEAVELFVARARAQRPGFALEGDAPDAVREIARLLDGLPLAIELAAARIRVLSPAQILERLRDRFALLAGARGTGSRQATLKAAIDWSWTLLALWEQAALAQCAVFDGGFTLEAAEAVLDLSEWPAAPPPIDVVQALADKSLLRTWLPRGGPRLDIAEPHFGMYLSVHEYAAQRLQATGHAPRLEARHGAHYAESGSDAAIEALSRHGGAERRRALALEIDNLVTACRRAMRRGDAAQAVPLLQAAGEVLIARGPTMLAAELAGQVLAMPALDAPAALGALQVRAAALWRAGHPAQAEGLMREAITRAEALQEPLQAARAQATLGTLLWEIGRMDDAVAVLESAIAALEAQGDRVRLAAALVNLGSVHMRAARISLAQACYERGIALHREVGNRFSLGSALGNLGAVYYEQGKTEVTLRLLQESLPESRAAGDRRSEATALSNLGLLLCDAGRLEEARPYFDEALALHRQVGDRRSECGALFGMGVLAYREGNLHEALERTQAALVLAREMKNPTYIGGALGNIADLSMELGDLDAAEAACLEAGDVLREAGLVMEQAKRLPSLGRLELRRGRLDAARACLHEAEAVAQSCGAADDSDLGQALALLRRELAAAESSAAAPSSG